MLILFTFASSYRDLKVGICVNIIGAIWDFLFVSTSPRFPSPIQSLAAYSRVSKSGQELMQLLAAKEATTALTEEGESVAVGKTLEKHNRPICPEQTYSTRTFTISVCGFN